VRYVHPCVIFDVPVVVFANVVVFEAGVMLLGRKQTVSLSVITTVTEIEPSNEGLAFIDYDQFAVMRPQCGQFPAGMAQNLDVGMFF
jgi:hypothetical protein